MDKHIASVAGTIVLLIGIGIGVAIARRPPPVYSGPPSHVHKWGKWTQPDFKADAWSGSRFYQSRVCEDCGEAEATRVVISAGH